ncbi:MAG TPA: hypothetical protein VM262_14075 [Acidimicrobiales bacterium]|nr:hypothetical protein [Acidimicrobiales bacterium]
MDVEVPPAVGRWTVASWALVAFVITPFAVQGLYRLLPDEVPGPDVWPFLAVGAAAVALGWWRPQWRLVALSVLFSNALCFVLLWWLLASMSVMQ